MATASFPGRIIIDHRPKTGGQAVTAWLSDKLGTGCVSPNLVGGSFELIRLYGGMHSVISAHINFLDRGAFDPRYQYVTCLREPVDRALSYLSFVLHDAAKNRHTMRHKAAAETFLKSEGKECPDDLLSNYSNHYINHFSAINASEFAQKEGSLPEDTKLEIALAAIRQYDVIGVYEDFSGYLMNIASMIGVDAPAEIPRVNVSTRPHRVDEISPRLRERMLELNQHDIKFYDQIIEWKNDKALPIPVTILKPKSGWTKYQSQQRPLTKEILGSVSLTSAVPYLVTNEQGALSIEVHNYSDQNWGDDPRFPVMISYHWLRPSGETYLFDGRRTRLPSEGVLAGTSMSFDMSVVAPSEAGAYTLVISLVQEGHFWFERKGFEPKIIQVMVGDRAQATEVRRPWGWVGLVDRIRAIYKAPATPSGI